MFTEYGYQKVKKEDIPVFEQYYAQMEDYWASSICIDSILAWNDSIITYYKVIQEYLSAIAYDVQNQRYVSIPLLGSYENGHLKEAMQEVIHVFNMCNMDFIMTDVYQWMLRYYCALDGLSFQYTYDLGLSDYIYRIDDFKKGLDTQDSRYNIKYFMKKYNPVISEIRDEDVGECVSFIEESWCGENNCSNCELGCLKITAKNIIGEISKYNAKGVIIRCDGAVVAYCIVSVRGKTIMFHFKKTARHYRGINEVLHKECIERFAGDDVQYVNYTEDMNHEGLRKYKQRLAEYTLEHKYELCLKG